MNGEKDVEPLHICWTGATLLRGLKGGTPMWNKGLQGSPKPRSELN